MFQEKFLKAQIRISTQWKLGTNGKDGFLWSIMEVGLKELLWFLWKIYLSNTFCCLYVIAISRLRFRVNLHSCLNFKELLASNSCDITSSESRCYLFFFIFIFSFFNISAQVQLSAHSEQAFTQRVLFFKISSHGP